jgi:zinc transport system permease protein
MILVIALLTFPAAMARLFTHNLKRMMLLSVIFGFLFTLGGLWLSYELKLPSGATIILLGGVVLAVSFGISRLRFKSKKITAAV